MLVPSFGNDGEGCGGWCIAFSFHGTSLPRTWQSLTISPNSFGPSLVILRRFPPRPGPLGLIFEMGQGTQILWPHTYLISPCIHKFPNHSQENKLWSQKLRSRQIPSRANGVKGRDSKVRMECMAAAVARRWRCCEASISLRSIGCWFSFSFSFFLVFWLIMGVGWWVLILIDLFFLVHWWVLMILPPIGWVMIWLDWVSG